LKECKEAAYLGGLCGAQEDGSMLDWTCKK
jgi:hypothetical protein